MLTGSFGAQFSSLSVMRFRANIKNCISSNLLISVSCSNGCRLCVPNIMSLGACLKKSSRYNVSACLKRQNWRYFSASGLKDEKLIKKSKPTWKLKHANSILKISEYFFQKSSKSISTILSYTVSKLVRFLRHSVLYLSVASTTRDILLCRLEQMASRA